MKWLSGKCLTCGSIYIWLANVLSKFANNSLQSDKTGTWKHAKFALDVVHLRLFRALACLRDLFQGASPEGPARVRNLFIPNSF